MIFCQVQCAEKVVSDSLGLVGFVIGLVNWVVPEKIHTPPTDGILEILAGGGVEDSGNPGGRGG